MSPNLAVGCAPVIRSTFKIGLFATLGKGKRAQQSRVVLYIALDKDWTCIQLSRNGNTGMAIAIAGSTLECEAYQASHKRACSLRYDGKAPSDLGGLKEDLESLGYDAATVQRFVEAARKYMPGAELSNRDLA